MTESVRTSLLRTDRDRRAGGVAVDIRNGIEVTDLDIYYSDFLAVEGVSMTINPRSITALIGPSGCGKSTFLRSLNRMHEVIEGHTFAAAS